MAMKKGFFVLLVLAVLTAAVPASARKADKDKKFHILVVSSYHREYTWSRDTNRGFCAAMLKFGYFDSQNQADEYTKNDAVTTSRAVVKKVWMNAKHVSKADLEEESREIYRLARTFKPDLIFLGDDEAGEYVGRLYLDTEVPLVFWGFNDNPVKYGLVDTAVRPGHNVTGVYQSGYYGETLQLLKTLVPSVRTFAVLSDETVSGRTHYKGIEYLAREGALPLKWTATVATDDYDRWKNRILSLQKKVDAFYLVSLVGLKDRDGKPVPAADVVRWYTANVKIPEATRGHYVKDGLLCAADDSGYKQAWEAVDMAHAILENGVRPATTPARTPSRGALMVNRERAAALGIRLTPAMGIEQYFPAASPDGQ